MNRRRLRKWAACYFVEAVGIVSTIAALVLVVYIALGARQ
jgi:hypothetical protein